MLLEFFAGRETNVNQRAVRNGAVERPIMAIDVMVARCGISEAFGEVKAIWPRTFEVIIAIEGHFILGRWELFEDFAISNDDTM